MDKNFQHFLLRVAQSKTANLQCMLHTTNTRKRRSAPKSLMDRQHLAEGSFPKDENSVYESFLCKHVQLHCPAIHRKQIDVHFSACTRYVGMGFGTFHLKKACKCKKINMSEVRNNGTCEMCIRDRVSISQLCNIYVSILLLSLPQ